MFQKFMFLFAVLLIAGSAHAQGANTGVSLQIQPLIGSGSLCLDAKGGQTGNGVPVYVSHCHGTDNQRWTITASPADQHAIIGIGGYCLDVRGGGSRANGTPIELWACHFQSNQRFHLSPDGRIRETASGKCLIALAPTDGAPVVLDNCMNVPNEVFVIKH